VRRRRAVVIVSVLAVVGALLAGVAPAQAVDSPAGHLVSEAPAAGTPHVLDGRVLSIAEVGGTMVLGGTFGTARDDDSQARLTRHRLLAFDADTGRISTSFVPDPNGTVTTVIPAGDGTSVYVAGSFSSIGGVARKNVARVRVSDGAVLGSFNAGAITGQVKDLRLADGRLWLAGAFTKVQGRSQGALATVDPATGAFDPFMGLPVAGVNNGGRTDVTKIDVTPDGSRLVAIGNFDTIAGTRHHQLFLLDLTGATASVAGFQTAFYEGQCSASFNTYMRDVDFSPDGSFFVVSTTGAYRGADSPCDETSRWETSSVGNGLTPSWTDYTGGDTTYAVEITDSAVYTGGHFRWQNNAFAGDRAGAGAVARTGLTALDPQSGLPFSWNPTRTRGVGVFDFLLTSRGLWVGSDTDRIGKRVYKGRIALLPLDGESLPAVRTPTLPDDLYVAGATGSSPLARHWYDGGGIGASTDVPTGAVDWAQVRGAFMLNGWLYVASSDGSFTRRTFDGSTYGPAVPVDTQDQLVTLTDWKNDIASATGMFYDSKRIYFTLSGSSQLFYRYFNPEDDVVGAKRLVASNGVSGVDLSQVRGMFGTGSRLFWAQPDGSLRSAEWRDGAAAGAPVAGTAAQVAGPGADGGWAARALFLFQGPGGAAAQPPSSTQADVTFVAADSTTGNRVHHTVQVPASVRPGDTLVLFLTTNSVTRTVADDLGGWSLVESVDGNSTRGRAWTRQATAADAGSTVTVDTSGYAKSVLAVAAYRGSGGASRVSASASDAARSTTATHTTPPVPVDTPGSWLVSYWSQKSSGTTTWAPPATVTTRTAAAGSGTGNVSALLADSAGPVPTGTAAGRTASTGTADGRVVLFSVVVAPA
jgi:hypothetical protein